MTAGRKRGGTPFGAKKDPKPRKPSAKDRHRAAAKGRAAQGMGTGGKPGGTKSAGGKGWGKRQARFGGATGARKSGP